ncbi:MAG: peptide chain release factor N(5)-glutamine methyltransferase [Anaerotardibacter sp.]
MAEVWTVKSILDWCCDYLERHGDSQPRLSAQWLLSEATGLSRIELYTNLERPLSMDERSRMREWVKRRGEGEPLQLIVGTAPFRYLTLHVAPNVLIPRPETEVLVSEAFQKLNLPKVCARVEVDEEGERIIDSSLPSLSVLDLCTGSGCIACSIASEYPAAHVVATDISPDALLLAQKNVESLGLSERVEVKESDLFAALLPECSDSFDLVISNPPYVPTSVCETLDKEVKEFEPILALDGGEDGLDVLRAMLEGMKCSLKPGGLFALELFEGHMKQAAKLCIEFGFNDVEIKKDLAGKERILLGRKPE